MNRFVFAVGLVAVVAGASSAVAVNPLNAGVTPSTGAEPAAAVNYKTLMTPRERTAFRQVMRTSATVDDCTAYVRDWQTKLDARAKEKGVASVNMPKTDACERKSTAAKADPAAKPAAPATPATPAAPAAGK
ncbi:MAG: hypothetical protein ABI886_00840 [Betaproteobacteria bacterium]